MDDLQPALSVRTRWKKTFLICAVMCSLLASGALGQIDESSIYTYATVLLSSTLIIVSCSLMLRTKHAKYVYTISYIFWLTACAVSPIFFYLETLDILRFDEHGMMHVINGSPFWQFALQWFLDISTNIPGEISIIELSLFVIVIPQVLSFITSGIFGCGNRPVLISTSIRYAWLFLAKFFCVFAGIAFAKLVFLINYKVIWYYDGSLGTVLHDLAPDAETPSLSLMLAFICSLGYFYSPRMMDVFGLGARSIPLIDSIRRYMTQYTEP